MANTMTIYVSVQSVFRLQLHINTSDHIQKKILHRPRSVVRKLIPLDTEPARVKLIKLAYITSWADGRLCKQPAPLTNWIIMPTGNTA